MIFNILGETYFLTLKDVHGHIVGPDIVWDLGFYRLVLYEDVFNI